MCGRTCLTLGAEEIQCSCKFPKTNSKNPVDGNGKQEYLIPEWRSEFNFGRKYEPSYNIAPTDITPVLVSADHFGGDDENKFGRVIVPMMWGMIPFWHKCDYRKHGLTTNNARLEHMLESKLYRGPFTKGQRCVILCEGFYEWQTTKSAKPSDRAAYYLHVAQEDGVKMHDKSTWEFKNINLLKLAGLFDIWEDEKGDKIFSYSVITFESSKIMSWLHHRMPAILETEEQVSNWLDFKRVPNDVALATLRPAANLSWHQVSNQVNNSRNKSEKCNKPKSEIQKEKITPKSKCMQSWLIVRKRKEEELRKELPESEDSDNENDAKRTRYNKSRKSGDKNTDSVSTDLENQSVDNHAKNP